MLTFYARIPKTISQTHVNNILISADTTSTISYCWIAKGTLLLASITSQDGETDPNFHRCQ